MSVRLSVNINDETAAALRDLAASNGTSVTEVIRCSVSVYAFMQKAQDSGRQIRVVKRPPWWQFWNWFDPHAGEITNVTLLE